MKTIFALACVSALALPARSANVVADVVAGQAGPRAFAPALPALTPAPSLTVTVLGATPSAFLAAPGLQAPALVPAQAALTPAAAAMAGPAAPAAAAITPELKAAAPAPAAAAVETKTSAVGAAAVLAAGIERARAQDDVATELNRAFDRSETRSAGADEPVLGRGAAASRDGGEVGLKPSAPAAEKAAAPSPSALQVLAGVWRKVSGPGFDRVKTTASQDGVQVRYGSSFEYGYGFSNVNAGVVADSPWRGSAIAPGGLVTRETTTRFSGSKIEQVSVRTETHWVRIPNRLVETRTLEARDGRLIETSESTLYRKVFFYFGPYTVKTRINTTNLADPARPLTTTVYEREGAPASGPQAASATDSQSAPAPARPGAPSSASTKLAATAYAVPALAAAGQAAPHHAAAAAIGAIVGFVALGLVGWARRDKSSGGDFNFTPLFNAVRVVIYGLGGAAVAAVAATAVTHPGGLAFAFHPGAATLRSAAGAAAGFAAGAALGWARRDKNSGGDFGFGILFNGIKMLIFGLIGAVVGAVGAGLI